MGEKGSFVTATAGRSTWSVRLNAALGLVLLASGSFLLGSAQSSGAASVRDGVWAWGLSAAVGLVLSILALLRVQGDDA